MKKINFAAVFSAIFIATLFFTHVARAQMNTSLYINEIEYKHPGHLEIEFADNTVNNFTINWSNKEAFNVFDKNGNRIQSEILSMGKDWLLINIPKITEGEIYTFELKRVSYQTRNDIVYTGFFSAIANWKIEYKEPPRFRKQLLNNNASTQDVIVRRMDYDRGGRLKIDFAGRQGEKLNLEWNGKEKIVVTDETGTAYNAHIEEYGKNRMEVRIINVIENMNYTVEISNLTYNEQSIFFKLAFTARDDWKYRPPKPQT